MKPVTAVDTPSRAPMWAWANLSVLFVAYTFSFIDRSIVSLMIEPLKADLALSDTQVSLLHGLAFAIFYTLLGIPIARLADSRSRRGIIAAGVAIWSVATCLCGLAGRFSQLFLARVGVGVGEAALSPAAYSMITDMFPRRLLGRALGIYTMGLYIGAGMAYLVGGWLLELTTASTDWLPAALSDFRPWQIVFFIVGAPGILIALLVMLMREPPRQTVAAASGFSLSEVFRFVGHERRTFLTHFLGFSLIGVLFNGFLAWLPTLMIRQLGMSVAEAGTSVGITILVFGTLGIYAGGMHTDAHLQRGNNDAPIRTGLLAALWLLPVSLAMVLVSIPWLKLALLAVFFFWAAFPYAASAAAIQIASPPQLRAQMSALYLFCLNFLGIGLGATIIALITDYVLHSEAALPWSMAITALVCVPSAAWALSACRRPFAASVEARERESLDNH